MTDSYKGSMSSTFYEQRRSQMPKNIVKSSVSFCAVGTYTHKSCAKNVDVIDTRGKKMPWLEKYMVILFVIVMCVSETSLVKILR